MRPTGTAITPELAELLGLLAADGYVSRDGRHARLTNNDLLIRGRAMELWSRVFLGQSREWIGTSGFDVDASVEAVNFSGANTVGPWLREQLYTSTAFKQVPPVVLNASRELQRSFLAGYYAGDGLKKGNGRIHQDKQRRSRPGPVLAVFQPRTARIRLCRAACRTRAITN